VSADNPNPCIGCQGENGLGDCGDCPLETGCDELPGPGEDSSFDDWSTEGAEAIGSCDDCGVDVYEGEGETVDDELLCDQCAWMREATK